MKVLTKVDSLRPGLSRQGLTKKYHLDLIPGYDPWLDSDDYYFDSEAADHVIDFFDIFLIHVKGQKANNSFTLEPWEIGILACTFGFKRKLDNTRRYREVFIFVPRKNGKTTLSAGLVLYVMYCDHEPGAEIYCAAADRENARLLFEQTTAMVTANPSLSSRGIVYRNSIVLKGTNTFFKPLSADAKTKHGFNSHLVVVDELHAQPNRELVDVLNTSTGSRRQPLIVYITTSDYARESICNEKYSFATKIRDKIITAPDYLPVIYETLPTEDWKDPVIWKKANPNFGISISEEYLTKECQKAKETPTYENTFKRLHLNMQTAQDVLWIPMDKWDLCNGVVPESELNDAECFGGLDLASSVDVAAFVLYFPASGAVVPHFFVPEETSLLRELKGRIPYNTWGKQGLIHLTPGNVIDYDYIKAVILQCRAKYYIQEVGFDRWNSSQLIIQLRGEGLHMEEFGQGFASMNAPAKDFEKLIIQKHFKHGGHPVLRWMASNVSVQMDPAGNIKPAKNKSTEKIDGIVALIMGIGRAIMKPPASVYAERGLITL